MKNRINYAFIGLVALSGGLAIWLNWRSVALVGAAYGLNRVRIWAKGWL